MEKVMFSGQQQEAEDDALELYCALALALLATVKCRAWVVTAGRHDDSRRCCAACSRAGTDLWSLERAVQRGDEGLAACGSRSEDDVVAQSMSSLPPHGPTKPICRSGGRPASLRRYCAQPPHLQDIFALSALPEHNGLSSLYPSLLLVYTFYAL